MVMKLDPYGVLMINRGNRILIVFHLFAAINILTLSTILVANVTNLSRFATLTFCLKTLFKVFCVFHLYIIIIYMIGLPLRDKVSMNVAK